MDGVALEAGMMQADGIHPSVEAQPVLLDNLWPVLEPMLALE
jgi:acyl-CoA thioesterase-1